MNNNVNNDKLHTGYKVLFYFMSLKLLFLLVFLLTVPIPSFDSLYAVLMDPEKWFGGIKKYWVAVVSLLAVLLACVCAWYVQHRWSSVSNPSYTIVEIKNENYEYLTFMTSFIMPLVCMDFNDLRYVLVFFVLLFIIGFIFIRMDLYYGNPTLAFMGYRLYRASIACNGELNSVVLITKDELDKDTSIKWIRIDKYVWVVRRIKS